jgi:hypothetical protein
MRANLFLGVIGWYFIMPPFQTRKARPFPVLPYRSKAVAAAWTLL